jgi:hypothetical protein
MVGTACAAAGTASKMSSAALPAMVRGDMGAL